MKIEHKVDPVLKRIENYPRIEEQLDLLYKGFVEDMKAGKELAPSHAEWVKAIKDIKDKYPKSS